MKNNFDLNRSIIISSIEQIIYKGGASNYVIFNLGEHYYIQLAAGRKDVEIYCEAVGDYYLETIQLSVEQKDCLKKLGWNLPSDSSSNYAINYQVDTEKSRENLAKLIYETAVQVYGCNEIKHEDVILNFA